MIELKDLCTKGSSSIAQKDLEGHDGIYPIYGASGFIKNVDFYQQEKPYIAVVKDGAGVGRVMCLPEKSSVIGTMQYIIPNDGVNAKYLAYALEHLNLAKYYTGATIPHIYFKDYCKEKLPAHPPEDQSRIASILGRVTDLIALRKEQLAALDQLVKSRFIELFGDTKSNERKWNTLPLHKVLESGSSVSYGIVQTGDDIEGGVPVFRPIDIAGGKIPRREQLKRTANDISNQYSRTLLKGYELLITVRGSVGETFRVTSEFAGCNVGRNIVPLRFDTEIVDYSFMQHFFAQEGTKRVLESMTKGIALQGLNMSEFREIDVIIPAMSLQQQFVAFVEQTDKSKLAIQRSLDELETLKKALMQKYFG